MNIKDKRDFFEKIPFIYLMYIGYIVKRNCIKYSVRGDKVQNNGMDAYNSIFLFNKIVAVSVFQVFLFWLIIDLM
ncbi:hypothetical protein COL84_13755 [Bacillus pseudomycoides]|nr:hypothetical protein CN619_21450 [Bacillus pseudomycoides]PGA62231.1 hypothetical protein COL84_13755 [Bacillus pseudomycoides]